MTYAAQARAFIEKLIRLQREMERRKFVRADQPAVRHSREHLVKYLDYHGYKKDEQMRRFFDSNIEHIRTLLPTDQHPAFPKLMNEFMQLKP